MAQIIKSSEPDVTFLIDEASGNLTYLGRAKVGSNTSDPVWQIKRIIKEGTVNSIQFADGDRNFDNVWDNRGGLTYTN